MEIKQFLDTEGLALYDELIKIFINSKIFVGTQSQYQEANAKGEIPINAIVIITDDENDAAAGTFAILGQGVLGQMILGQGGN